MIFSHSEFSRPQTRLAEFAHFNPGPALRAVRDLHACLMFAFATPRIRRCLKAVSHCTLDLTDAFGACIQQLFDLC